MRTTSESEWGDRGAGVRREVDAAELGRALSRRRAWILGPALVCLLASAIGVNIVSPRYTAESKILLENQESFFTRPDRSDANAQTPLPDEEAVQSQVQLISSRDLAREAIKRLDLAGNAEFDPASSGFGPVSRLLILLGIQRDPLRAGAEERLLSAYYERLNAYPIVRSRVITVQFTSVDPDLAAKAANTVADLYIDLQRNAKRDSARAAAASLANLIADLKLKVAQADTKAQDYRARNGLLVGTNNTTITSQQLSDLTTQLAQARNTEAESQAKAKLLRDMIRQNRITEVSDVANSDIVRRIAEQRISLKAQIAQQAMTLLPGHPRMRELQAQLVDLDSQMRSAADKVVRTLENDSHIAAGRVENLKSAIDVQKQTATLASTDQVALNELEQQARLFKDQLDFSTQKYQEAIARENALTTPADARVISRAVAPELPSFPKKLPVIAIFTLAGLVLSIGIVVARELLSGRAFLAERPEAGMAPPMADVMPATLTASSDPAMQEPAPAAFGRMTPSALAEPVPEGRVEEDLASMLERVADHQTDGSGVRVLVVRSADVAAMQPHGALALSRGLARRSRVILIDCGADEGLDGLLAAPRTAEAAPVRGLQNLLAGDTSFAEVIHRDPMSRLHIVPLGTGSLEHLDGGFGMLVDALSETYDHVVLAVPTPDGEAPIRGSAQADIAILLVTAGTDPTIVERDRADLHRAGVPSVYVLDVADLADMPDSQSAAA